MKRKAKNKLKKRFGVLAALSPVLLLGGFQLYSLFSGISKNFSASVEHSSAFEIKSFEDLSVIACPGKISTQKSVQFVPTQIKIEKIGLNMKVLSVPLSGGTWKVNGGFANYAEGTGKVGVVGGNVGIYGHDRTKEFAPIKSLSEGDVIEVFDAGHRATYKVESFNVVSPGEVEVFSQTAKSELTLVTCTGSFSSQRYIVKAELVSISEINCPVATK